jgi:hypothetical protein
VPGRFPSHESMLDRLPDIRSTTRSTTSLARSRKTFIYLGAGERIRTADLPLTRRLCRSTRVHDGRLSWLDVRLASCGVHVHRHVSTAVVSTAIARPTGPARLTFRFRSGESVSPPSSDLLIRSYSACACQHGSGRSECPRTFTAVQARPYSLRYFAAVRAFRLSGGWTGLHGSVGVSLRRPTHRTGGCSVHPVRSGKPSRQGCRLLAADGAEPPYPPVSPPGGHDAPQT